MVVNYSLLLVVSGEYFQDLISTLKQATLHSLVSKVNYEVKHVVRVLHLFADQCKAIIIMLLL